MNHRTALADAEASEDDPTRFPGERRSTAGLFTGLDGRLVHVSPTGRLREYSDALRPQSGLVVGEFGLSDDGEVTPFSAFEPVEQRYVGETARIETRYRSDGTTVTQTDLAVDDAHLTHLSVDGTEAGSLCGLLTFAPDGESGRVGQLVHEECVEVYHRTERDFVAVSTGIEECGGVRAPTFASGQRGLGTEASLEAGRHEDGRLGDTVRLVAPFEEGEVTVVTLLTDSEETERSDALATLAGYADRFDSHERIVEAAEAQAGTVLPDPETAPGTGLSDLRVLSLLSAPTGARIAGPEFDHFYAHSGGYGYTWFRDDAEIAGFLLDADLASELDLSAWHAKSAAFYRETQRSDGTWPHRVWSFDGSLAPGWANARIEGGEIEYQADQTASVVTFLARYLRETTPTPEEALETGDVLTRGLSELDGSLAEDGLPGACQNAWENMTGRFSHTAATFLTAYSELARAPLSGEVTDRADARAERVYDAIDDLWCEERGVYALRLHDSEREDRLDASTLALVSAHLAYDAISGVDDERLDRLVSHLETTIDGLSRESEAISGLARFEGDDWRVGEQEGEKVWTVSTAWAAHAALRLADLLDSHGRDGELIRDRGVGLLSLVSPGGPLCVEGEYLPEQFFDDGSPDSATPLGWPHAIRLASHVRLANDEERVGTTPVPTD